LNRSARIRECHNPDASLLGFLLVAIPSRAVAPPAATVTVRILSFKHDGRSPLLCFNKHYFDTFFVEAMRTAVLRFPERANAESRLKKGPDSTDSRSGMHR
jgi:hypothetical protein